MDCDAATFWKLTGEEKSVRKEEAMEIDAVTIDAAVTEQLKKVISSIPTSTGATESQDVDS